MMMSWRDRDSGVVVAVVLALGAARAGGLALGMFR